MTDKLISRADSAAPADSTYDWNQGYAAGIKATAKALGPSKVTYEVELGPVTLRALYEVLYEIGLLSDNQRMALRAELAKTEPKL
jgi:hypothetical protein